MRKIINCLTEHNPLINKPLKKVSVEEGMKIATELFEILNQRKDGIGLAANQVGIDAQVAVVNVREPLVLINPEYISQEVEIPYYEGCLSFKGKGVNTKRFRDVVIKTEQSESHWYFSGVEHIIEGKGSWEEQVESKKQDTELRLLESICVKHEIDHLNGVTINDRKFITTIVNNNKVGRNDPCHCGSGKKHKKCCM